MMFDVRFVKELTQPEQIAVNFRTLVYVSVDRTCEALARCVRLDPRESTGHTFPAATI